VNCGAEVTGKFCANCGQETLKTRENFVMLQAISYLTFFIMIPNFLAVLYRFYKPGFLTKNIGKGDVPYIHPLRLFFFVTLCLSGSTAFFDRFGNEIMSKIISIQLRSLHFKNQ